MCAVSGPGRRARAAALLIGLAVAGCASPVPGDAAPARDGAPTPAGAASSSAAAPAAADGSDVSACRDGDCEIVVTAAAEIPLDPMFGVNRLAITAVSGTTVDAVAETGSGVSSRVTGGGRVVSRSRGGGSTVEISRLRPDSTATINRISFRVVSVSGASAVLDVSPA